MNIYKVNHLTDVNTISKIHVFYGDHTSDLTELFQNDPNNSLFAEIFNQEELTAILNPRKKIPVIFSHQSIHIDDTIGVIKSKIMHEFDNTFSLEEIYLFCMKEEELSAYNIYKMLTQNKRIKLNRIRLDNFLLNIIRDQKGVQVEFNIPDKEIYTYDDILALNVDGKIFMMNKVLGQKFFIVENEYPFVCNPFQVLEYDAMIERNVRKTMTTLNSHLLLNTGKIVANNIYLCTATDVLEYKNDPLTIQLYYPFLFDKKIDSLESLEEKRIELIEKGKKMYTEAQFKGVDLFYNVYKLRTSELNYKKRGIKAIKFVIHPEFKVKIPIDIIFKIVHATQTSSFIKYNPGARQDKLLRMYADKVSQDGRKIPYLPKAIIFKLIKLVGRNKSVSIYINEINGTCEFEENGDMTFYVEFEQAIDEIAIEALLREKLNPVLETIKSYFEQNGYNMSLFESLKDKHVEVKQLQYQSVVRINREFDIKNLKGCVSNIFVVESEDIAKGINMRFKRVANFNKMSSMEAFVIEQQKDGLRDVEIIDALLENYKDLTQKDAITLLAKMASELQIERGAKKGVAEIKNNPGFKVLISFNQMSSDLTIQIESINDVAYLETIPIYLDTLVRLTQDETSTHVPIKDIQDSCSNKEKEVVESVYNDIIPVHEMSYVDQDDLGEGYVLADEDILFDQEEEGEKVGNALSLFFNQGENEDEEEDEDEEDDEEDRKKDKKYGGSSSEENRDNESVPSFSQPMPSRNLPILDQQGTDAPSMIKNVDGMKLNNPYHFQTRIEERDPTLILTEKQGKYNSYSRTCPQNIRRQPVILTDEELNKIKRDHPGYLNENSDIIKYGSQPDKQFYYICPRYWDLRTDTIITPDEIERQNLQDKIIPMDAKSVPKGKYIYEFNNPKDYKANHKQYPGFLTGSHPDGLCLPCCFAKWNVPSLIDRKQKCAGKEPTKPAANDMDEYIKGPGKFPLAINRWGYLPPAIQVLLREKNTTCKRGNTCLLRHGVEISKNQSFIACISDALYYTRQDFVSIREMKETIISTLTIDNFITYQNGNLITDFYDPDTNRPDNIEDPKYLNTALYSKLTESEIDFFIKVCNAFENFVAYLNNEEVLIDYTYLWDIICTPNPALFKEGLNLVILEIPNNDITDNVNLICPTNHYNTMTYETQKPTLILFHQDVYFEPIYTYKTEKDPKNKEDVLYVGKLFREQDPGLSEQIKYLFDYVIKPYYKNMCAPFASMPKVYKAKHPILLQDMVKILNEYNYIIRNQVVNYQGKVIGVVAETSLPTATNGFIPCYPSSLLFNMNYVFMMDPTIWKPYSETIAFLKNAHKNTFGKIPCSPVFKIIEDEVVVGVLTETNQFVQLSVPSPVSEIPDDNLREIRDNNYVVNKNATPLISSDSIITMSNKVDADREDYVKKIKLETGLYQLFRTTIRMMLNDYNNLQIREEIENIINSPFAIYNEKLKNTTELLRRLVEDDVIFVKDYDYKLINELTTCAVNKSADKCNSNAPLCAFTINGKCQLIIPKENLLTRSDNEKIYFLKMADELIRYNRIKSFMFEKQTYLSFGKVDYNLKEDEFIILQSLVTQEYFEGLIPTKQNKFIKYNSYDEANPITSQTYVGQVNLPKGK